MDIVLTQVRPLALRYRAQFRPDGPDALTSKRYARDVYPDLSAVRTDVREARIVSGLHFRHSMLDGDTLGTQVAAWITARH